MNRRPLRRTAFPLAAALALGFAGTAHAEITGTITSTGGAPVNGAEVNLLDPAGQQVSRDFTNSAGIYEFSDSRIGAAVGPFTIAVKETDNCADLRDPNREKTTSAGPVNNPGVLNAQLPLTGFCEGFRGSGPPATALIDQERQLVIGKPGARAYIRSERSFFGATGVSLTLPDGTLVGGLVPGSSSALQVFLPGPSYTGPFFLNYTSREGALVSYQLGQLESRTVRRSPAFPGRFDLLNIVDISGSMGGSDRGKRRADAMELVLGLSGPGDRVGAIGFDNKRRSIFKLQTITPNKVRPLGRIARKRTINRGGTDYDVAFDYAFQTLTAKGVDPKRPKAAIFLTDGGHNGTYENSHLKLAYNPTGRTWPVCVVQLGKRSFDREDVARLKRIARETGGLYVKAPTNAKLTDVYFRCRGTNSGAKTLGKKAWRVKKGQKRTLKRKLPRGPQGGDLLRRLGQGDLQRRADRPEGQEDHRRASEAPQERLVPPRSHLRLLHGQDAAKRKLAPGRPRSQGQRNRHAEHDARWESIVEVARRAARARRPPTSCCRAGSSCS